MSRPQADTAVQDPPAREPAAPVEYDPPWVIAKTRGALQLLGRFYAFCLDTFVQMFRRPVQVREFVEQAWFVAKVSFLPTLLVAIPFCVIIVFQINQLLG